MLLNPATPRLILGVSVPIFIEQNCFLSGKCFQLEERDIALSIARTTKKFWHRKGLTVEWTLNDLTFFSNLPSNLKSLRCANQLYAGSKLGRLVVFLLLLLLLLLLQHSKKQ